MHLHLNGRSVSLPSSFSRSVFPLLRRDTFSVSPAHACLRRKPTPLSCPSLAVKAASLKGFRKITTLLQPR